MLSSFPFTSLMMLTMTASTMMAISSSNWLFSWLALEINMMSFIPLIMTTNSNQETESAIKYFLIQALGSSLLLMYSMTLSYQSLASPAVPILLMLSLLIKLGAAPFHPWFPQVMSGSSWFTCFLLSTWQKLAPLTLLCFMFSGCPHMLLFSALTSGVGGMMGLNQAKLRSLMAYSSLVHLGWMIALSYAGYPILSITYFTIYTMIIAPLFTTFHFMGSRSISLGSSTLSFSPMYPPVVGLLLLSLAGIPPLTGFIPKWISMAALWTSPGILIVLILSSLLSTYYYLNLVFSALLSSPKLQITPLPTSSYNHWTSLLLASSASSLFLAPVLMI